MEGGSGGHPRRVPETSKTMRVDTVRSDVAPIGLEPETAQQSMPRVKTQAAGPGLIGGESRRRCCRRCGYDLSGLDSAKVCPECGFTTRVKRSSRVFGEGLTTAPIEWLRVLNLGAKCLVLGFLAWVSGIFALGWTMNPVLGLWPVCGAGLWVAGAWLVLRDRSASETSAEVPSREWPTLRVWARWLQFGLVLATFAIALEYAAVVGSTWWVVKLILALPGFVGLGILLGFMARIADWGNDDDAANYLKVSVFTMPIALVQLTFMAAYWPTFWSFGLGFGAWLVRGFGFVLVSPSVLALWSVWKFHSMAGWAVTNNLTRMDNLERQRERFERERAARARETTARAPEAPPSRTPHAEG